MSSMQYRSRSAISMARLVKLTGFVDTRAFEFSESTMLKKHLPYPPEFPPTDN